MISSGDENHRVKNVRPTQTLPLHLVLKGHSPAEYVAAFLEDTC